MGVYIQIEVSKVIEFMRNCVRTYIDTLIEPSHRQAFDYSIKSLNLYEIYLNRYKKSAYDLLDHKNISFTILGSYLGEVIVRNLGGEWVGYIDTYAMFDVKAPLVFISIGQNYLANPISEAAWKIKYGEEHRIMNYYAALSTDLARLHKSRISSNVKPKFDYLFHEAYLTDIFDSRENEYDELGYFMNYLTIPIVKMNDWFK